MMTKKPQRGNQKISIVLVVFTVVVAVCGLTIYSISNAEKPEAGVPHETRHTTASDYMGLTDEQAKKKATSKNHAYRIVEVDGKGQIVTDDYRAGRVNVSLDNGIVVKAEYY